jgi:hypothetical protein
MPDRIVAIAEREQLLTGHDSVLPMNQFPE